MNLDDVRRIKIPRQKRHRVGRGSGSGWGVTSGRGNKGAGQRSGAQFRLRFEGGQMPIYRRLPKKGFTNHQFKTDFHAVNVGQLARAFASGATVDVATLKKAGLAPKRAEFIKVLGHGDLPHALTLRVHAVSEGARGKVEASGGAVTLLPTEREHRPKFVRKDGTVSRVVKRAARTAARKAAAPKATNEDEG